MKTLTLINGENGLELERPDQNWILLKDYGYSPVQMLVASVAACGQYVFKSILERSSIEASLKNVAVSYDVDESSKSHQVTSIAITFEVIAAPELHDKIGRTLRLVNEYCPVIQSLDPKIVIEKTIKYLD